MQISDTLDFLLGTWDLERSIEDHRSGIRGVFSGSAALVAAGQSWSSVAGRARYDESGELSFGTHVGPASRYLEHARRDTGSVMLYFADGRPFVDLDLRRGQWRSIHDCGDDRYEIVTMARSHDVVQEYWRVRGPGKSYSAVTTLLRAG
jgi:hypothetical protein